MTSANRLGSQGRFYEDIGVWARLPAAVPPSPRAALFLDRDGVILEDAGYLCSPADIALLSGVAEIIASANRRGVPVIEVTNQSGIGRGYYGWEQFLEVEAAVAGELAQGGAVIDAMFACPYHREGIAPWAHPAHPARKPRPGMLLAARRFLNIDLENSWIVGDRLGDLAAGHNAGLRGGLHVLTGHGAKDRQAVVEWRPAAFDVRTGDSIRDAAPLIDLLTSTS